MSWQDRLIKRIFDIVVSLVALLLLWWLILVAFVIASVDTRANGFFLQERIGKNGRRFKVIKIRTMRETSCSESGQTVSTVTTADDVRVTRVGRVFRHFKIDEIPQLLNVLRGEMSVVGPRPDVSGFADSLEGEDRLILEVRPGLTGPATLKYRREEQLLAQQLDPEQFNRDVVFPDKVRINRQYVENYSFGKDIKLIWKTLFG